MEILDPTTEAVTQTIAWAPRPSSLSGKKVALIDNTKFNSDQLLLRLADRLSRRYGMTVSRMVRKRSPSHEVDEAAIDALRKQSDFVVSGIGD